MRRGNLARKNQAGGRWRIVGVGKKLVGRKIFSEVKLEGENPSGGRWWVAGGMIGFGSFPTRVKDVSKVIPIFHFRIISSIFAQFSCF